MIGRFFILQKRFSGHNKWSKIKRDKGANDLQRCRLFGKLSTQIISAIKAGKGETDPSLNLYLASALSAARRAQMPKSNIEQAFQKATLKGGSSEGDAHAILYEGLGPLGVACIVEAITTNRNKTFNQVRHLFIKYGSLTSVSYLFRKYAFLILSPPGHSTQESILENLLEIQGILDFIVNEKGQLEIQCDEKSVSLVSKELKKLGCEILEFDFRYDSDQKVEISADSEFHEFLESMEQLDDIVRVHHNATSLL